MRLMRSWMRRRSASSWLSPGPPRKPKPPRWRSRWVQERTRRLFWYCRWASSTCSVPSRVEARLPKISRMRPVRSSTLAPHSFSRFRCWMGESWALTTTSSASVSFTRSAISATLPEPRRVAGLGAVTGAMMLSAISRSMASARPTASSSRASTARSEVTGALRSRRSTWRTMARVTSGPSIWKSTPVPLPALPRWVNRLPAPHRRG